MYLEIFLRPAQGRAVETVDLLYHPVGQSDVTRRIVVRFDDFGHVDAEGHSEHKQGKFHQVLLHTAQHVDRPFRFRDEKISQRIVDISLTSRKEEWKSLGVRPFQSQKTGRSESRSGGQDALGKPPSMASIFVCLTIRIKQQLHFFHIFRGMSDIHRSDLPTVNSAEKIRITYNPRQ